MDVVRMYKIMDTIHINVTIPYRFQHAIMDDCSMNRMGQNLAFNTGSKDLKKLVDLWVAEQADYQLDTNTCSAVCGHYTQVVWADTTKVRLDAVYVSGVLDRSNQQVSPPGRSDAVYQADMIKVSPA